MRPSGASRCADRGFLPEVRLASRPAPFNAAEDLAAMRIEVCNALKTLARGNRRSCRPSLTGASNKTKWASPGRRESPASRRRAQIFDRRTRARREDAFAAIIGFPPGFYDHADIPRLARFGELLTRPEAADGVLLLGPGTCGARQGERLQGARRPRVSDRRGRGPPDRRAKGTLVGADRGGQRLRPCGAGWDCAAGASAVGLGADR